MIKINNVRLIQSVLDQGFLLPNSGGFLLNGLKCISTKTKGKQDNLSTVSWSTPNPPGLTPMGQREPISFDDYKNAFKEKSLTEMTRALFVLRLCSYNYVVDNSLKLMHLTEQTLGSTLFSSIMKTTMYGQFVAGEDKHTIQETTKKLRKSGIEPMLALPMEEDVEEGCRESRFDGNLEAVLDCMRLSAELDSKHPMMQIKVTGLMSGDLCAKLSSICPAPHDDVIDHVTAVMAGNVECNVQGLTAEENASFQAALGRFREIGEMSRRSGVLVWVDAEYTYMNPALNLVSLAMMLNYNQDRPLIGYTYQNYLKTTFDRLKRDVEFIEGRGVCFAAKLVRGAYMDKERALARSEGHEDPVRATLADTNNTYHESMTLMLNKVSQNPEKFAVILATHNEETVQLAIKLINDLSLDPRCGRVFFGQVLGMCDQVSYSLGIGDYLVYKSLPYGSVKETLPYLCRRAQENRSVLHRVGRERALLRKAVLYRVTGLS